MVTFKSIRPATKFKSSVFREQLRAAAEKMAPEIERDFARTTATWKKKPKFKREVRVGNAAGGSLAKQATGSASGVALEVSTTDEVYGYVDSGTRPHIIRPRRKKALAFQSKYKAKTKPNVIGSTAGGRSGRTIVTPKPVKHPGTKARRFTETIRKKWTPTFRASMQEAINEAAKKSGHGA